MSGGATFLALAVSLAIAGVVTGILWRRRLGLVAKVALATAIPLITLALLTWDVCITSTQMAALCPSEGLHIRRTVATDSILTNFGSPEAFLKSGFRLVELRRAGRTLVYSIKDGSVSREVFETSREEYVPKSRYEFVWGQPQALPGYRNIGSTRSYARDRETGDELGSALTYTAYPGWFDKMTFQKLQLFVWQCPNSSAFPHAELFQKAIRPL